MKNKIDYEILNKRVEYLIEKLDSLEDFVNFDPADFLKRLAKPEDKDTIEGDMTFLGKVGNKIEVKDSKNGKKFLSTSGFSTTKEGEEFEYTWVRFIQFEAEKPEWLVPKAGIEVKGKLELDVYNDKLDISCRVSELKEWVKQQ